MTATLLSIVEFGGYPDFTPLYQSLGYQVLKAVSMRKVVSLLKKEQPDVIVAEFNFQSDFRDRTSNLETLLATRQTRCPESRVIIFFEPGQQVHLEKLLARFTVYATIPFPVSEERLKKAIAGD